jgi:levansucrase
MMQQWQPDFSGVDNARMAAPLIVEGDIRRVSPDIDIWDAWPVQHPDGSVVGFAGGYSLWMALGAPRFDDPDERHSHARIHLLRECRGQWQVLGPAMPDGFSPGSREWSGSAVLWPDGQRLTLYFTAAGRRGEAETTFEQRLFSADADLSMMGEQARLINWRDLREFVVRDPAYYMDSNSGSGRVNTIKAFRDPAYFRDPATGLHHVFFAGSQAGATSGFNGVVGRAVSADLVTWTTCPPVITATGVNNELERPHIVHQDGVYYLFWSTQRHVFNPEGPVGPTGLYGMAGTSIDGPWTPLNGNGLVMMNPPEVPRQAYSWLVMPDLQVTSFVDDWGRGADQGEARQFGATFAPMLRLQPDGFARLHVCR